jgi:hypothetical protein
VALVAFCEGTSSGEPSVLAVTLPPAQGKTFLQILVAAYFVGMGLRVGICVPSAVVQRQFLASLPADFLLAVLGNYCGHLSVVLATSVSRQN